MTWRPRFSSLLLVVAVFAAGCASILQYDKADKALKTEEYDKKVQITPVEPAKPEVKELQPTAEEKTPKKKRHGKHRKHKAAVAKPKPPGPHEPDMEDSEGFVGRRPIKDPFRPGEKVTLAVSYFNIVGGNATLETKPMVEVNGKKSYQFEVDVKTNSFFKHIYSLDDSAITYLSYDELIPESLQISLKESKQLAEARTFFDWKTMKASYWQKKVTKEHGEESKKVEWDIKPYTQNVISAAFYLRTFQFAVGKKLAFRVADEGKNIVFSGEVLRKEKLSTDVGELDTWVLKPKITVDGVFAPVGDILMWLTADDRKFLVRLEGKIKIGTIVAKVKAIDKGQEQAP